MEKLGNPTFGFDFNSYEETGKEVKSLKSRKVSRYRYCFLFPVYNFNNLLSCFKFPTSIKYAEVTHIHKKVDRTDKKVFAQ